MTFGLLCTTIVLDVGSVAATAQNEKQSQPPIVAQGWRSTEQEAKEKMIDKVWILHYEYSDHSGYAIIAVYADKEVAEKSKRLLDLCGDTARTFYLSEHTLEARPKGVVQ